MRRDPRPGTTSAGTRHSSGDVADAPAPGPARPGDVLLAMAAPARSGGGGRARRCRGSPDRLRRRQRRRRGAASPSRAGSRSAGATGRAGATARRPVKTGDGRRGRRPAGDHPTGDARRSTGEDARRVRDGSTACSRARRLRGRRADQHRPTTPAGPATPARAARAVGALRRSCSAAVRTLGTARARRSKSDGRDHRGHRRRRARRDRSRTALRRPAALPRAAHNIDAMILGSRTRSPSRQADLESLEAQQTLPRATRPRCRRSRVTCRRRPAYVAAARTPLGRRLPRRARARLGRARRRCRGGAHRRRRAAAVRGARRARWCCRAWLGAPARLRRRRRTAAGRGSPCRRLGQPEALGSGRARSRSSRASWSGSVDGQHAVAEVEDVARARRGRPR